MSFTSNRKSPKQRVSRAKGRPSLRALNSASRTQPKRAATSSLRDIAYDQIKHLIITCAFRPGEYINELQLSVSLGIGRTPVHQALDRLMVEGLVDVIPRKGVIVKPVTLNEVLNIIDVRLLNEGHCARLAAMRGDSSDLSSLVDILKRTEHWSGKRDVEKMMLLDREFHLAVAKASKNDVLGELLRTLHERSLRYWFISLNEPGYFLAVQVEHSAIIEAILERDGDAAEQAMRAHIELFRSNVSRFL